MDDVLDCVEAFVDGEAVDRDRLSAALADRRGRDHLIALLALRDLIGAEPVEHPASSSTARASERVMWRRWVPAVAAVALLSVWAGYSAGRWSAESRARVARARLETPAAAQASAPTPTRVIHLQNGVDWTERAGGH